MASLTVKYLFCNLISATKVKVWLMLLAFEPCNWLQLRWQTITNSLWAKCWETKSKKLFSSALTAGDIWQQTTIHSNGHLSHMWLIDLLKCLWPGPVIKVFSRIQRADYAHFIIYLFICMKLVRRLGLELLLLNVWDRARTNCE